MKLLSTSLLVLGLAAASFAQTFFAEGEIVPPIGENPSPVFRRPDSLTTLVAFGEEGVEAGYGVHAFTVDQSGTYAAEMDSPFRMGARLLVYAGAFDPENPLANLLNGNGAFNAPRESMALLEEPGASRARIAADADENFAPGAGLDLTAGTTYYAVATSLFDSSYASEMEGLVGYGPYRIGIGGGPGNVTSPSAVPEPATMAALGLGAAALLRRRRKSA